MAYADVRDVLLASVAAVPSIGVTHGRERYVSDQAAYLEVFKTTVSNQKQIRGWSVTREAALGDIESFGRYQRTHRYVVWGIMGLADGQDTESTFQDLTDDVCDALDGIDAGDLGANDCGPASCRLIEKRMFGSVLCHYAEIEFPVVIGFAIP